MDEKELFKVIVKAYYENNFEVTVSNLLESNIESKECMAKTIASLCGVELTYNSSNYIDDLKCAILNYRNNKKIVTKIKDCSMNCTNQDGKTKCQESCPFDAIKIDTDKHTTFIDNTKCTDCGFCVDACPNNNYLDKIEFLPLISSL